MLDYTAIAVWFGGALVWAVYNWWKSMRAGEGFSIQKLVEGLVVGLAVAVVATLEHLGAGSGTIMMVLHLLGGYAGTDLSHGTIKQILDFAGQYNKQHSGSSGN